MTTECWSYLKRLPCESVKWYLFNFFSLRGEQCQKFLDARRLPGLRNDVHSRHARVSSCNRFFRECSPPGGWLAAANSARRQKGLAVIKCSGNSREHFATAPQRNRIGGSFGIGGCKLGTASTWTVHCYPGSRRTKLGDCGEAQSSRGAVGTVVAI